MKNKLALLGIVGLAMIGLAYGLFSAFNGGTSDGSLPSYAHASPKIEQAYMLAVAEPDLLNGVDCYCGCMQHLHNGRIHSRGLLDCFRVGDSGFDMHGSQCDMCVNDALDTKALSDQGMTKDDINAKFAVKYANL